MASSSSGCPESRPLVLVGRKPARDISDGIVECGEKWHRQYGDLVVYQNGRNMTLLCSDVDLIKHMMTRIGEYPGRSHQDQLFKPNASLLWTEGRRWKALRTTLAPTFHSKSLDGFSKLMNRCSADIEKYFDAFAGKDIPTDVSRAFRNMALDVIGSSAFGQELHTVQGVETKLTSTISEFQTFARSSNSQLLFKFFISLVSIPRDFMMKWWPEHKFSRLANIAADVIGASLKERRADPNVAAMHHDFLTTMMNAENPDTGKPLSDAEILENTVLFLFAGHETTGWTLAFMLYHVSQHLDVERKLLAEIDALNDGSDEDEITRQDLEKYQYLDWTLNESMRTLSIAPLVIRKPHKDVVLGDQHIIPKDTAILIPVHNLHMSEKYWIDPLKFRPERFDPTSEEFKQRPRFAFLPFGGGPRICIGYKFALQEMKVSLIRIYRKFRFTLDETKTPTPLNLYCQVTRCCLDGMHMFVHRRHQTAPAE